MTCTHITYRRRWLGFCRWRPASKAGFSGSRKRTGSGSAGGRRCAFCPALDERTLRDIGINLSVKLPPTPTATQSNADAGVRRAGALMPTLSPAASGPAQGWQPEPL